MITYTELTNEVVAILEIASTDLARFNVVQNINNAQLELVNILPYKFLKNVVKTAKGDLTADISQYQWPSDYIRFIDLWLDFVNEITVDNPGRKAVEFEDEGFYSSNIDAIATKQFPFVDLNVENGFGVYPVPDANVTNGFRLRYIWKMPDISSSQNSLLDYNLKGLLVKRAVVLSALVEGFNESLSADYLKLYNDELAGFLPKKDKQ